jgi:hypothetical protein
MPKNMNDLLDEISRHHFPNPPATPEEFEEFEQRVGWRMDPDLRAFYLHCNGADLFHPPPDPPYRIRPLARIVRARLAIMGEDDDAYGPASLYTLCYVQDGDYVLIDTSLQQEGRYPIIDGWHEFFPQYCKPIAASFSEFLEKALRSHGKQFWLHTQSG